MAGWKAGWSESLRATAAAGLQGAARAGFFWRAAPLLAALAAGPAAAAGNAANGAALAASRQQGLCVLCHALPGQPAALQGDIGPPLAGVGARLTPEQLRQRLLAPERFHPDTVMPAYGRSHGLQQVPAALQGRPLLSPHQIDDLVAWLSSLQ